MGMQDIGGGSHNYLFMARSLVKWAKCRESVILNTSQGRNGAPLDSETKESDDE